MPDALMVDPKFTDDVLREFRRCLDSEPDRGVGILQNTNVMAERINDIPAATRTGSLQMVRATTEIIDYRMLSSSSTVNSASTLELDPCLIYCGSQTSPVSLFLLLGRIMAYAL